RKWNELLDRYHYLGAPGLVGANLKYLVFGRQGELLGAVGWQSAVKDLGCRDRLVGWDAPQRARGLDHVVNGVRFLILPWVGVETCCSRCWRVRFSWCSARCKEIKPLPGENACKVSRINGRPNYPRRGI